VGEDEEEKQDVVTCPSCKLENPADAQRCDCGYVFAAPTTAPELREITQSLRTIKRILILWTVLSLLGAVIWGVSIVLFTAGVPR
jgi:hypothetical protein